MDSNSRWASSTWSKSRRIRDLSAVPLAPHPRIFFWKIGMVRSTRMRILIEGTEEEEEGGMVKSTSAPSYFAQKSRICTQKSLIYTQKSPIHTQKSATCTQMRQSSEVHASILVDIVACLFFWSLCVSMCKYLNTERHTHARHTQRKGARRKDLSLSRPISQCLSRALSLSLPHSNGGINMGARCLANANLNTALSPRPPTTPLPPYPLPLRERVRRR